ncbi:MAG TPA: DedA family protein, partial [Candidatus Aenigmarchaeota archaeon]|nr:DedA family protein [Candidatus Aenigmarchaeota archaeon]
VLSYGLFGTFVIAVLESFIFPVPTAVIITPSTALGLDPLITTIIATIGSVIGALIGFALGWYLGYPFALKLFKGKHIDRVERWFKKYGACAILIAAFTPIPFKVFTWAGGIFRMNIKPFLLAATIGRFFQFIIAAYVGSMIGPAFISLMSLF